MIKMLSVRNYKSLRDVELELGKYNVLVGPSNGGKSNILDCLAFLSETSQRPVSDVLAERGRYEEVVFGGEVVDIELGIDFLLDGEIGQYVLCYDGEEVVEERLTVGGEAKLALSRSHAMVLRDDGSWQEGIEDRRSSAVCIFGQDEGFPYVKRFRDYIGSWRLHDFFVAEMRQHYEARRALDLERSGRNLNQVLISLRGMCPEVFDRVEQLLIKGIPEVEKLLTLLTADGKTYVAVREEVLEREFTCCHLSDGILRLLAYITATCLPESSMLCLEEPENSVHPRLLKLIVDMLHDSEKQVILSSHSPYIINFVEAADVRVVEKKHGETQVRMIEGVRGLRDTLRVVLS